MIQRPTGTVTFPFTDLEASTRLWQEHPASMGAALARHERQARVLESTRTILGERHWDGAFRSGAGMSEEAAVRHALDWL